MRDEGLLTVGQVVERSGLSRKALRVYEQAALVMPVNRTAAGYRLYDVQVLPRLDLIRRARALDVPIRELGELLDMAEGSSKRAHQDLAGLVSQKLDQVEQRIAELRELQQLLRNVGQRLRSENPGAGKPVHGCGSLLCTCPVNALTGEGGDDMNPVDVQDKNSDGPSTSCDCGCECCTPQSSDNGGDQIVDKDAHRGTGVGAEKANVGCACGCGD